MEITVTINGSPETVVAGLTLAGLLAARRIRPETVVVELNGRIASRPEYGCTPVAAGDRLEILRFMGGG